MKIKCYLLIALFILAMISFPSCNAVENLTTSASRLIILNILGQDLNGVDSNTAFVDVIVENDDGSTTIFNSYGSAYLQAEMIDPNKVASDITYYNNIIVDQIDVQYTRNGGLNQEGEDIPYSFSQQVNALIEIGENYTLPFMLVQHIAKLESPLVDLVNLQQEKILKMEATVTFHSKDLGGNRLAPVTGTISIWCANFADN
jgi:hypothetical protein